MKQTSSQRFGWMALLLALLGGCASAPEQYQVKEVYVCAAEECGPAAQKYSARQMLAALEQLVRLNDGEPVAICGSDPKTRICENRGQCHFVQGGPIPGIGCAHSITLTEAAGDPQNGQLRFKANMFRTFVGVPLACATFGGVLTVRSPDEISYVADAHYCNWMAVGNMSATFSFALESMDLDRGLVGGYWSHAVAGTGSGAGSGYTVWKFPKVMPRGVNWLASGQGTAAGTGESPK